MQQPQQPKPQPQEPDNASCNPIPETQKLVNKEALEIAKRQKALIQKTDAIVQK